MYNSYVVGCSICSRRNYFKYKILHTELLYIHFFSLQRLISSLSNLTSSIVSEGLKEGRRHEVFWNENGRRRVWRKGLIPETPGSLTQWFSITRSLCLGVLRYRFITRDRWIFCLVPEKEWDTLSHPYILGGSKLPIGSSSTTKFNSRIYVRPTHLTGKRVRTPR